MFTTLRGARRDVGKIRSELERVIRVTRQDVFDGYMDAAMIGFHELERIADRLDEVYVSIDDVLKGKRG